MDDSTPSDLDRQARALLERWGTPKRRARPRVSRAMMDAEEHEIALPSGPLAAWRLGVGPGILLVHGWEDDNALWGPLADQFAGIGRAVITMDLPGHGFTQATDASPRGAAKAVREAAKALGPIDAVVGHSYGCTASIVALAQGLDAARAVMIASPIPRTGPRRRHPDREDDAPPEVVERALQLRAEGEDARRQQVEEMIGAMTAPALIVHSIDDEQCPVGNAQRMAELWPGSELLLVDGQGHRFVAQDAAVLQRVVEFCETYRG
ncbi:MAG TPA: alpha/beta hydrolase [Caulobacteraceae bacterium]|nr:alpha/beta hydrolase [Caulobacteraceae bacterium]